jgi:predicted metal-dependent TIM-barrel fold hydrolase
MKYMDPHIHMVSRTTDDYKHMALAGCVCITEPAFWNSFDRGSVDGFRDYFLQLTQYEPKRAAKYGIEYYSWICINPKEADDPAFAREVIAIIPESLEADCVVGVGEIGLNKNTKNELVILEEQIAIAEEYNQLILVHTPHLEDKLKGTRLIMDAIEANSGIDPDRVLIDHAEEHTVSEILDRGYWAGLTIYPNTKCTPQRAADIIEIYGPDRIWINSAADWGDSDPLSVPKLRFEMQQRGHSNDLIEKITYRNPVEFLGQSEKFLHGHKSHEYVRI